MKKNNKKNSNDNIKDASSTKSFSYFPGHMAKTKREIKEKLELIDIVYEIVDARIPRSSKIKDLDDLIKNKERILIMTKKDLCDFNETNKWINYYKEAGYKVLLLDLKNERDFKKIIDITHDVTLKLQEKRNAKGLKNKEIKALVVGIPNVGKSTLINRLVGKNVCNTENKPGVTKNLNFLPTKYGITLLDSPGILWPKLENREEALNIASIGSIKKDVINLNEVLYYLIDFYIKYYPSIIKDIYKINKTDIDEIINEIAHKYNFYYSGEVDYTKVANKIYNDLVNGVIKGVTFDRI